MDIVYIEDYQNSTGIDFYEMILYVSENKKRQIDLKDFVFIEQGFRKKWNASYGMIVGDGDFINAVYRYIEELWDHKIVSELIDQEVVKDTVNLILDYMQSKGQWYSDVSKS